MAKTNSGLVEYAKSKVGCYYWFGTFGQMASRSLYNSKKKQYPDYYTASDFNTQIANPKQVFDCAGLIKAYLWTNDIDDTHPVYKSSQDFGATGFYNNAKVKGSISSFDKIAGRLVFRGTDKTKTHVGVYIGDGYVVEAKGHAYGVVKSTYDSSKWQYWAQCHLIEEDVKPEPQPEPQPQPQPQPQPTPEPTGDKHSDAYVGTWKTTAHSGLWMRSEPNGNKIICIPYNSTVTSSGDYRSEYDGDWLKISYDGKSGYSFMQYLSKVSDGSYSSEYVGTWQVTATSGLWMRSGAGTGNSKITCLNYGQKVSCNGYYKNVDGTIWLNITAGSQTGWSSSDWLRKL